jgi:hypothetical protein
MVIEKAVRVAGNCPEGRTFQPAGAAALELDVIE